MRKINNLIIFGMGVIIFLISLLLDKNISHILSPIKNQVFDIIFNWFASFINIFVILILVTTLFLFEERKHEWIFPLWLSFLFSIGASVILKLITARPRPAELFYPLVNALNFSFPSMHAMVAFAAVPILNREFPKLNWFWIVFALLVSFSRLYTNVHFLSDVVFGAFSGYFI